MSDSILIGRNAVLEALKAGRPIEKIYLQKGAEGGSIPAIVGACKRRQIPVQLTDRKSLDQMSQENHQGVIARVSAVSYVEVSDILEKAAEAGEDPFLLVCESIQDPHNLGAIVRTALCCGVHGIVISRHHAVPLTDAVAKTAAGALEYVPIAKVSSIASLIDSLKKQNIWTACADMDGDNVFTKDLRGPLALVIGGEHEGISRLVKEKCDFNVSIPMKGTVGSLNASVAAGVLMYEVMRKRQYG